MNTHATLSQPCILSCVSILAINSVTTISYTSITDVVFHQHRCPLFGGVCCTCFDTWCVSVDEDEGLAYQACTTLILSSSPCVDHIKLTFQLEHGSSFITPPLVRHPIPLSFCPCDARTEQRACRAVCVQITSRAAQSIHHIDCHLDTMETMIIIMISRHLLSSNHTLLAMFRVRQLVYLEMAVGAMRLTYSTR
jgi:hypothetical protein